MFECEPLFVSNLYYKHLDLNNDAIIADCLTVKEHDSGRFLSNSGGYQTNELSFEFLNDNKCFNLIKLIESIEQSILDLPQRLGFLCLDDVWININGKGNHNNQHSHPDCVMSGTYYVTDSNQNTGEIVFIREKVESLHNLSDSYDINFIHNPELCSSRPFGFPRGSLIIFPSHVQHRVDTNMTDDLRFSISFNIVRRQ